MAYKFLEHTADLKVSVEEPSLNEAFKTSAMALKEAMAEKIKVMSNDLRFIAVEGKDLSDLLYNFLEEFLFMLDADNFILSKVEDLEIEEEKKGKEKTYNLSARIIGDKASNYKFSNDVKAITFNEMKIQEDKKTKKTTIQFVLDV